MTADRCLDPACLDGPTDDDEARPRWAVEGTLTCRRCALHLEQRLAELPAHATALRAVLGGISGSVRGENKPTKGSPPVPLNIAAHDHLTAMQAVVVSWVRLVCEERSLRGPDRPDLAVMSAYLLHQLPWLLQHPAVGDLADEMRDLTRVAEGLGQTKERWNRLPVACPDCQGQDMGRWDGDSLVHCRDCGVSWGEDEYPRLVHLLATDTRTSVTAAEAVAAAGVSPEVFRQWVSRKKVRKLGTAYGVARYSADDLQRAMGADEGEDVA